MNRIFVDCKIHRATVTDANLDYVGSISLCPSLIEELELAPFEFVHVNNVETGLHWETYIIPGAKGDVVLNGPPAHHFKRGDKVIIFTLLHLEPKYINDFRHVTLFVDDNNRPTRKDIHRLREVDGQRMIDTTSVDLSAKYKDDNRIGV